MREEREGFKKKEKKPDSCIVVNSGIAAVGPRGL
jgi:hypothetical protein